MIRPLETDLEIWLKEILSKEPDAKHPYWIVPWSFPTAQMRAEYLATVNSRSEEEVLCLLRCFLFDSTTFGHDTEARKYIAIASATSPNRRLSEYERRLRRPGTPAQPGVRWVLDLLPRAPRDAINVIDSYSAAHISALTDGRLDGLGDASAIVRTFYLQRIPGDALAALETLTPREFEILTERLYNRMGYETHLTPSSRDDGRDVLARRVESGESGLTLVECKHHKKNVGVAYVRALLGTVEHERANKGTLITLKGFSRGAKKFADGEHRIELVSGEALVRLLNSAFGTEWPARLGLILRDVRIRGQMR